MSALDEEAMANYTALMDGVVMDDGAESDEVLDFLGEKREILERMESEKEVLSSYQSLLNIPKHDFANLQSTSEIFEKKNEIWSKIKDWEDTVEDWSNQQWSDLKPEEMDQEIQTRMKDATRLFKIDEDAVSARLKKSVARWKGFAPTLVALGNEALKERHWRKIFETLQQPYATSFQLQDLIEWSVFSHKETMEEISGVASGEYALELQLAKIKENWAEAVFQVKGLGFRV